MFKYQNVQFFFLNSTNVSTFNPLEVVGRGSDTQLQVGDKCIKLTKWDKG